MSAAYHRHMPRRRAGNERAWEYFRFAVETWDFDYSFRVNVDHGPDDPLGLCWEGHEVIISGPLRSKTRRRCERVTLTLNPEGVKPGDWKPEWRGFGRVVGVRGGALTGYVRLPPSSFQSFMTALAAGKVRGVYVHVDDVVHGAGVITHFFTVDPDADDE